MAKEFPIVFLIDNSQAMFGKNFHLFVQKIQEIKRSMIQDPNVLETGRVMVWAVNKDIQPLNEFQDISDLFRFDSESKIKISNSGQLESNFGDAFNRLYSVLASRDTKKSFRPLVVSFMPILPSDEWRETAVKLEKIGNLVCISEESVRLELAKVIKDCFSINEKWPEYYITGLLQSWNSAWKNRGFGV